MTRRYIDCRAYPSDMKCSVALSADTDSELLEAAVQHAVAVHRQNDAGFRFHRFAAAAGGCSRSISSSFSTHSALTHSCMRARNCGSAA